VTLQELINWHLDQQHNKLFHKQAVELLNYFMVPVGDEREFISSLEHHIPALAALDKHLAELREQEKR